MTTDATLEAVVQKTVNDIDVEDEVERLLANAPQYRAAVHETESSVESNKVRAVTSTAAEITIYNVETGEPSQVIYDALKARMRQRFPDDHSNPDFANKRVYTLHREDAPAPIRGEMACPLYYKNPTPEAVALGFGIGGRACSKPPYFLTEYDIELHVEKNHKRYHELKQRADADKERREYMDLQRQTLAAMQAMGVQQSAPQRIVSKPIVEPDVADYDANGVTNTLTCECGWMTVKGSSSLGIHKRMHCPLREGAA